MNSTEWPSHGYVDLYTSQPTIQSTSQPTSLTSDASTGQQASQPTSLTSDDPTGQPTRQPSSLPSDHPTGQPTSQVSSPPLVCVPTYKSISLYKLSSLVPAPCGYNQQYISLHQLSSLVTPCVSQPTLVSCQSSTCLHQSTYLYQSPISNITFQATGHHRQATGRERLGVMAYSSFHSCRWTMNCFCFHLFSTWSYSTCMHPWRHDPYSSALSARQDTTSQSC